MGEADTAEDNGCGEGEVERKGEVGGGARRASFHSAARAMTREDRQGPTKLILCMQVQTG